MNDEQKILEQLSTLYQEHKTLDSTLASMLQLKNACDQLNLQRLKKRKLLLKDEIAKLESSLHPDIIA